jgi:hypothetical protein
MDETAAHTLVHIRDTPTNDILRNLKRKRIAKKTKTRNNKPETEAQKKRYMKQYLTNQTPWTYSRLKGQSYEQIVNLYRLARKWNDDFIPMYSAEESRRFKIGGFQLESNSSKKQKTYVSAQEQKELTEEQLKHMLNIVPYDSMNADALQPKKPNHRLGELH